MFQEFLGKLYSMKVISFDMLDNLGYFKMTDLHFICAYKIWAHFLQRVGLTSINTGLYGSSPSLFHNYVIIFTLELFSVKSVMLNFM